MHLIATVANSLDTIPTHSPIIPPNPPPQLEDVAGPRPLELMVSSARSRLSAVMATPATDVREESR